MINAEKFKEIFGCYATEIWSMPENEFLDWLNSEYQYLAEPKKMSNLISKMEQIVDIIENLPSAERDIPVKPIETTDRAWGIPKKQAVCPKCDYYLGHIAFLDDYKGKRITYCETCGQAIDWEGWDFDE